MAIGKRLTDPIKVVSVTCDDAIDSERTPLWDYEIERDPSKVVALPGQRLTWFTIAPLRGDAAAQCRTYSSPIAERLAFARACTDCSDPDVIPPEGWTTTGTMRHLRDDSLNVLPDQLITELGRVVLQLGELTRGEPLRFVPPAGLRVIRRRASGTTARSAESSTPETHGD